MLRSPLPSRTPLIAIGCGWAVLVVTLAIGVAIDYRLYDSGRTDLLQVWQLNSVPFSLALLSAAIVGSALIARRPGHPVGWLFLALAVSVGIAGGADSYAVYGITFPGSLPATGFVATIADIIFMPWLALLGFILLLTPSGRLTSRAAQVAAVFVLGGFVVSFACGLVRPYRGEWATLGPVENPLELTALTDELNVIGVAAMIIMHVGLVIASGLVVVRFRSARGSARRQLRWMTVVAIPFPFLIVGAYIAAVADNQLMLVFAAGGFLAITPIGVWLAIEHDHLYDVDRLLSRSLSYALLTAALLGCYATFVTVLGAVLGDAAGGSQAAASLATLLTVSLALPARGWLQTSLDRRFNRRQFDAVTTIRRAIRQPSPSTTIEQALRTALGDETLSVAYWIDEKERWVDEAGNRAEVGEGAIRVERLGGVIAALRTGGALNDRRTIDAVVAEALTELENARLRAAIAIQLVEVRESRARIVAAQLAERHTIERNLHDGAQQRLLATALELRAAAVGEDPGRTREAIDSAVQQLQLAVVELRELANGLHPAVLADGGLAAALDDLAARTPVSVLLDVTQERFSPAVEGAAWFIVCEAVTNAVKHARPQLIDITAAGAGGWLHLSVKDDGIGGADPAGIGLRGIADRAEAAGGWLTVAERLTGGTNVTAELPCGS